MGVVEELIQGNGDGTLSFGNYLLETKTKKADFKFEGDTYKIKTFKEITRLERAASAWNALRRSRRGSGEAGTERGGVRGGYPWALSGPGRDGLLSGGAGGESRDWGWNGVPARGTAPAVDEARWAEWADRAFRRDSRRYDGGFYLY